MKKYFLVCFSMLLFVSASAFENGGKQKFERDRFVLLEHSQVLLDNMFISTQNELLPVTAFADRPTMKSDPLSVKCTSEIVIDLKVHKDVGWQSNIGVRQYQTLVAQLKENEPYKNCLRVYSYSS